LKPRAKLYFHYFGRPPRVIILAGVDKMSHPGSVPVSFDGMVAGRRLERGFIVTL